MTLKKGDKVQILSDPYGGMLGDVVGKVATVTVVKGKGYFVGLKIKGGASVKTWAVKAGTGEITLKKLGSGNASKPASIYSESKPGLKPGTTVRLKVTGGQQDHPLFIGLDSKGRSKYELIPPKGKTARAVAREFRKAAAAGKPVLGGQVYSIRLAKDGAVHPYWKAGKGKADKGGGSKSASKPKPPPTPKPKPPKGKATPTGDAAGVIEKYTPDKTKLVKKAVLWAHPTHGQIMLKRIPKWVDLPGEPGIQGPNPEVTALFKAGWKPVKLKNPHSGRRY